MSRWTVSAASATSLAMLAGACAQTPPAPDAFASPSPVAVQVPPLKPPPEPTMTVITVTKDGPTLGEGVLTTDRLVERLKELAAAEAPMPVFVTPGDPQVSADAVEKVKAQVRAAGLQLVTRVGEVEAKPANISIDADGRYWIDGVKAKPGDIEELLRASRGAEEN